MHEDQSADYATAKLKYIINDPLSFVYESTGEVTRFTDYRDPKPRSRPVFTFHRPETLEVLIRETKTLRAKVFDIPVSPSFSSPEGGGRVGAGLRDCQVTAINNLEKSFRENRPKALVQMATGSGKTFTAITSIYRLLKFAKAKRILFLVNTKNLGEQAEQEFRRFEPQDDNRLFPELYGVTRLSSSFIPHDSQVYISTIQRLYYSHPLEKKPGMSLKEVLERIHLGDTSEDMLTTLANRLIRLDKQINEKEKMSFAEKAGGQTINHVVKELLNAYDADTVEGVRCKVEGENPGASPEQINSLLTTHHSQPIEKATAVFNDPDLRNYIIDIRKKYDQVIDTINPDEIVNIGWVKDNKAAAENTVHDFKAWIEQHKTEITALQIFYAQPYQRRELSYKMIKDLVETIKTTKPVLAPLHVWQAYNQLEKVKGQPKNELIALVSLIRKVSGMDAILTSFDKTVDKNFQDWIFKKQAGTLKYTEEQVQWLRMIKDYIANSFHVDRDDFELDPFNKQGGLGKMWQLFGEQTDEIINELNESLVA
ncbi:type I restriction-modification enzyme R subunit C-terminal domain-containing protein [Segetibacter koreensis]|uniref:type I restriction-modification enzyme R subunit C-terminal domain-containing protein n=1 Tax=Segetibacter koreensis TaxID=398037 RepID=UPI0004773BB0|nr:type I restriction-modification enzyme R subunit C-terminal domain-containing protein [Segetibacter koreensis]